MRTHLPVLTCLAAVVGCVEPTMAPATVTGPDHAEHDSTSILTEFWPAHPVHAVWDRPPTPAMLKAWNGAARRWGRILIPDLGREPVVLTADNPCWELFGLGAAIEPLTVLIREIPGRQRGAYAYPCTQGLAGRILLASGWWERDSDPVTITLNENTLVHEIGHILGIGLGWKTLDDAGRVTGRGGYWGGKVVLVRSLLPKLYGEPPDTADWPYRDDPRSAEILTELTDGDWEDAMVPLDRSETHWHGCLAPPIGCHKPIPNGCALVEVGGDVMGYGARITLLTLDALDPELWNWAPSAAEPFGRPEGGDRIHWEQSKLPQCPRPL